LKLHYVFEYTDVDRAFWTEHLEGWVPERVFDAHVHVTDPGLRDRAPTDAERRAFWVNEVNEPMTLETARRCNAALYPGRDVKMLIFGHPSLRYDVEAANAYTSRAAAAAGWKGLALLAPEWTQNELVRALELPAIVGVKPYYSMIRGGSSDRNDEMEAGIFDFVPHRHLEVLDERRAWMTLHVPRAGRLGDPANVREITELRRRYPNVVLVVAHLGRSYTLPHAEEGIPPLAGDPGIYFDNSAVMNPDVHRLALETVGAERILYGTDNPVFYMRGRRQWQGRRYINRTSHPFHFNAEREPPEIEAAYTLYTYVALKALKDVSEELGLARRDVENIFHGNAERLLNRVG